MTRDELINKRSSLYKYLDEEGISIGFCPFTGVIIYGTDKESRESELEIALWDDEE